MLRVRPTVRATAAAAALVLMSGLTACGSDPEQANAGTETAPAADTSSEHPDASTTAPTEPQEPPDSSSPVEPDGPSSSTTGPGGGLRTALVPGNQLPSLNAESAWSTAQTSRSEPQLPAWVCQRVSLISNGAVTTWTRSYTSAGRSTATQVVGEFADARSAQLAFESLAANGRDCAAQLEERGREAVRPPAPLAGLEVGQGQAAWGVVFSGPVRGAPDDAHIDAAVVVQTADRVSVLSMSHIGQDYNYETGQTPPELAGPVVATRLAAD
jgi:hypothetical protein